MKTIKSIALSFQFLAILLLLACGEDDPNPTDVVNDNGPVITIIAPTVANRSFDSDGDFNFDILFADDRGLESFSLSSPSLNIAIDSTLGGAMSFNFKRSITIAADAGSYDIIVMATDNAQNTTQDTITMTKAAAPPYVGDVYAVGDVAWNEWDQSKAMPMAIDENDNAWYEITLYSNGDDSGIKFIGQLDWAPNNWGLVNTSNPSEGMINDENSGKILLEQGYNTIRFNPSTLAYEVTVNNDLPASNGAFHAMGCGFQQVDGTDIDLCWDPSKAYPMVQDSRSPYLYRLTIQFTEATDLKFNGNQAWDDLDWGFPEAFEDDPNTPDLEEQKLAPAGDLLWTETAKSYGADWKFFDREGTYELILDEYLGKAQIRKIQ
ncbi:MAG: hypothetical protein RIA69_07935 [Cyclobacteriaceae bacterium]